MLINNNKKEELLAKWNEVFGSDIDVKEETNDSDELFNIFLDKYQQELKFNYSETSCVCFKSDKKLHLIKAEDNNIVHEEIGLNARKKLRQYINRFDTIITNFTLSMDLLNECYKSNKNKVFLRYELLHSLFNGSNSNYILDNIAFPNKNLSAYLVDAFINNIENLDFIKYSSYLLNYFENGFIIDDINIKPKITVSEYGRWYWSGKNKLQNDKNLRYKIIEKVLANGDKYVNIDFISASPTMLAKITNSATLKKLIISRIKNYEDTKYAENLKGLLNVFIHGNDNPVKSFRYLESKFDFNYVNTISGYNIKECLLNTYNELSTYNNKVIDKYRKDLVVKEVKRRLVNSDTPILDDKDLIKKHRVYLQGHIHDKILMLTKLIYDKTNILPLYTIHDSVNYWIPKTFNYDEFINALKLIKKDIKMPFRIEEY